MSCSVCGDGLDGNSSNLHSINKCGRLIGLNGISSRTADIQLVTTPAAPIHTCSTHSQLLEVCSGREIEEKHDEGDKEEASSQAGKQRDGDGYRDGGCEQDETVDPGVVEGIRQTLVDDVLILGKAHQQVPDRSLREDDDTTQIVK